MGRKTLKLILLFITVCFAIASQAQQYELNSGWKCLRARNAKSKGEIISKTDYGLSKEWIPAVVPGTVLTTLLANKLIPDPFYGMNNKKIPDIYDVGRDYYTFWFVKDFRERKPSDGEHIWLQFRGVNYGYRAYINGQLLNDEVNKGMYLRREYDITPYISEGGSNRIAVIVYPPDSVGNPNGGQGGDGVIAHDITNQYTAGWDWIQPVHDRNTGIWDKVIIKKTKQLSIENTHVVTRVPGVRKTSGDQAPAIVQVSIEAINVGNDSVLAEFTYEIARRKVAVSRVIGPNSKQAIKFPDLSIENPKLWWPNGVGPQDLYTLTVKSMIKRVVSDEENVTVGMRQLDAVWNTHTQSRELRVNGQRVFLRGGNRILSDEMLRFSKERYDAEVRYHHDMNLNLIRVWGGGITERPEFYDACDKYGILVMQDFWASGDCNGRWDDPMKKEDTSARRNYPDDHRLFVRSLEDQIKMLRNHPSLAYWCGGNEIRPPEDVLKSLRDTLLPRLDGTRFFFEYSNDDSMSYHSGDGPYTIQPDSFFWSHRSFPFNSEVGSVGIGDEESLEKFIPKKNMIPPFYDTTTRKWMVDSVWKYHKYIGYDSAIEAYGHPKDIHEFTKMAQLVNYNQYRALAEGYTSHMWDWYTGFIIWKTQNPWTAMLGQMYDVYLDPNACMYGLMEGCKPVHIMYDPVKKVVEIVNNTADTVKNLRMSYILYCDSFRQNVLYAIDEPIFPYIIPPGMCIAINYSFPQDRCPNGGMMDFSIRDDHNFIDNNFYWFPDKNGSFSYLYNLDTVSANATAKYNTDGSITVNIKNESKGTAAFFNHISLIDGKTQKRINPAFYSDNYVSISPRFQKNIRIEYTVQPGVVPMVCIEGLNTGRHYIKIENSFIDH